MSREILFRGKRVDGGEWIEGFYCKDEYNADRIWVRNKDNFLFLNWFEIVPETLSQFTGILDKNGKKIFEGDIIEHYIEELMYRGQISGHIEWNSANAGFSIMYESAAASISNIDMGYAEPVIIGNIYEQEAMK